MQRVICSTSTFGYEMTPAPSVQALFYLPRIGYGEMIEFLIDTGADTTCLNGIFALELQDDMVEYTLDDNALGVGGSCRYYHEPAIIVFEDEDKNTIGKDIMLCIKCIDENDIENDDLLNMPSLLGRDILNIATLNYDYPSNLIEMVF